MSMHTIDQHHQPHPMLLDAWICLLGFSPLRVARKLLEESQRRWRDEIIRRAEERKAQGQRPMSPAELARAKHRERTRLCTRRWRAAKVKKTMKS